MIFIMCFWQILSVDFDKFGYNAVTKWFLTWFLLLKSIISEVHNKKFCLLCDGLQKNTIFVANIITSINN